MRVPVTIDTSFTLPNARMKDGPDAYLHVVMDEVMHGAMRIVMFAAAHPNAGVTVVCAGLAASLSQRQATVLLADADVLVQLALRGVPPRRSLYRNITPDCLWVLGATEMDVVPDTENGPAVSVDAVLMTLKEHFDYIVVDAPALSQSDVARNLAPAVDGTVFLAVPYTTEMHGAVHAARVLTAEGGKLLGVIVNNAYQRFGAGE